MKGKAVFFFVVICGFIISVSVRAEAREVPFGPQSVISSAADAAASVYAADVDGDGDMDVLSASYYDDKISWYENQTIHRSAVFSGPRVVGG